MNDRCLNALRALCFLIAATPALAADEYFVCSSCHGERGQGVDAKNAPPLAGLDAGYVRRQMSAFKEGRRGADPNDRFGVEMALIAAAYDEAAIERLAAIIASFPVQPDSAADLTNGDARRGQTLYALCSACHGERGEGLPATGAPRLAGSKSKYFIRQLANFRDGRRGAHAADAAGASMARIVRAGLTGPTDIDDLAAFVDSMPH